jgi:osmotically-inducible protein OsmY
MSKWKVLSVVGGALILGGAFSSGAVARNSSNIGGLDDVRITTDVRGVIAQYQELAPNQIHVDTRDHVVYLSGMVYSALIGDDATETARRVPGVNRVVSTMWVQE